MNPPSPTPGNSKNSNAITSAESMRILFWNVNNKDLSDHVCELAKSARPDVIILNENTVPSQNTLRTLQDYVSSDFHTPRYISEDRFHCFCRKNDLDISEVHEGSRISVRKLNLGKQKALLVLIHGLDIRNYDEAARQSFAQSVASEIVFVKKDKGIKNDLIIGDFNMNPYDKGMNLAAGLNAMMTRACSSNGKRTFTGQSYDFYYNPMWGLFGDNTKGPAGTFYDTSAQGPYGWSLVDQIVVHHSLIPLFEDVEILTTAGEVSLMNKNGHPDSIKASDHFPILATFKMEKQ